MTEELEQLIEKARAIKLTPAQKRDQIISFAYGNVKLHNPDITREDVERFYDQSEIGRALNEPGI
jgi:hypothetical protein